MNITTLAEQINEAATEYKVGALQQLRKKLGKNPRTNKIFTKSTIKDTYAFHDGGRTELQFNVGLELRSEQRWWRHGVAFSFEKSQTLPDPSVLRPVVRNFNSWVHSNADMLRGFRMWVWEKHGHGRSEDRPPSEILNVDLEEAISKEKFVFLGTREPEAKVNVNHILRGLDRLYPLYKYCLEEFPPASGPIRHASQHQVSSARHTTASHSDAEIEVDLRHNLLQDLLVKLLKAEFHGCRVHPELEVANSCRVDVAVDTHDGFLFCEVKVAPHLREAVREAIGQLLEYAHWPNDRRAEKWWVVSKKEPSTEDISYLHALRTRYKLPVYYRRIDAEAEVLGPET